MTTINDLATTSSVSSADKIPVWSDANGVTRALPVSVLDGRYILQDDINQLATNATVETFSAGDGVAPNTFVPGVTSVLVLANLYYTSSNVEVFFDASFQGPDQFSVIAYALSFSSPIPVGVNKVYIRGGAVRLTGIPPDGSVGPQQLAAGAVTAPAIANGAVTAPALAAGAVTTVAIANNAVGQAQLADNSVSTTELVDLSVTTSKLALNSVTTNQLAPSAVTATDLAPQAVTSGAIANNAVGDLQLAWGAILPRVLGSVSALQNLNVSTYQRASTNAYYAGGQGAGDYYYDPTTPTASANGGTIIASLVGSGCWRLVPRGEVDLYVFGAKGDDSNDDTAAFNAAMNWCVTTGVVLRVRSAVSAYRLTSTIVIPGNFIVKGDGVAVVKTKNFTTNNTHGPGAWFHLDHTAPGFLSQAVGAVNQFSVEWSGIGTVRNQPVPNGAAAWTPAANDWDFYADTTDNTYRDVVVLNPTKGFYSTGGGRQLFYNVKGQPFSYGIYTDNAFDTCRYDQIHFWPWWSEAAGVQNYTKASGVAIQSSRNDNPMYSNIFCYAYWRSFNFSTNVNGSTSLATFENINCDATGAAVVLDATCSGATLFFTNLTVQGLNDATQSNSGVWTLPGSAGNQIRISNGWVGGFGADNIRLDGTNNLCWANQVRYGAWGLNNVAFPAVSCASGNTFRSDFPFNNYTAQNVLGGGGAFQVQLAKGVASGTTDGSGNAVIAHGSATPPNAAVVSFLSGSVAIVAQPTNTYTATTFTVNFRSPTTGAPLATGAFAIAYDLFFVQ